jgi:hypothetical protein
MSTVTVGQVLLAKLQTSGVTVSPLALTVASGPSP